jgi:hypothetical protein
MVLRTKYSCEQGFPMYPSSWDSRVGDFRGHFCGQSCGHFRAHFRGHYESFWYGTEGGSVSKHVSKRRHREGGTVNLEHHALDNISSLHSSAMLEKLRCKHGRGPSRSFVYRSFQFFHSRPPQTPCASHLRPRFAGPEVYEHGGVRVSD